MVAIDVSPTAIAALQDRARQLGLADRIDAQVVDLDAGLPADLAGRCSLVICQRFRDPKLYPQLVSALEPGGVLVVTVLSVVGASQPGPFHAPAGELAAAFGTDRLEILSSTEADGAATVVGRRR